MKYLFFAAVFSLAACGVDENNNNGTSNNGVSNNNGTTAPNNGTSNNGVSNNNGTTAPNNGVSNNNGTTAPPDLVAEIKISALTTDFATKTDHQTFTFTLYTEKEALVEKTQTTIDGGDVGISVGKDYYYILNRGALGVFEGSIKIYDFDGNLEGEVDMNDNIKDAVDVGDKIFVSSYESGMIQVIKKEGTTWTLSTPIDLNPLNPAAAIEGDDLDPEVDSIIANGNEVLVVLQTLTGFASVEKSRVAVIDAASETIVDQVAGGEADAVVLNYRNAFSGLIQVSPDTFAVGSIGDFTVLNADAGIEILSKGNDGLYTSTALINEEKLGQDLYSFVFTEDNAGFAVVGASFDQSQKLVAFEGGDLVALPGDIKSEDGERAIAQAGDYFALFAITSTGATITLFDKTSGKALATSPVVLQEGFKAPNLSITSVVGPANNL